MTNPEVTPTRALTDDEGDYTLNRTPAMNMLMEFTSAIEAFKMDGYDPVIRTHLESFFSDDGGIDWEEIGIPEDCYEFAIFYSLQEVALDLLSD